MTTTVHNTDGATAFTVSNERISALLQSLYEITDLDLLGALARWDQQTAMPEGAADVRMYQVATLQGLLHERITAPQLGDLLKALDDVIEQKHFTDADRGLVRHARRMYDRATKLPRALVEELARVEIASVSAWVNARKHNDFARFAPYLQRILDLRREVADRIGYTETRYDALLDEFEPGLTASRIETLFAPVRSASAALLRRIQASGRQIDASCLYGQFPPAQQEKLCAELVSRNGYDFTYGQIARSAHPFTSSFGSPLDVRFTVRYDEHYLQQSLMAALHEGGHALYEQGCARALMRTPLASGASLGMHESQSRLWENVLGRSLPYWQGRYAVVREVFPEQFKAVNVATFVRALNKVEPSLIRVEADEVTYNLHIIIRFELEKALLDGEIAVESLPGLWNARYKEYLGIEPENDAQGVLQDVHWSEGMIGYFPTYTLGNLYAAQIYHKLRAAFPDFDERLAAGDTSFVLQWLREHMYSVGATYQPQELLLRLTGEEANPQYFVRYLTSRFEQVYDLPPERV